MDAHETNERTDEQASGGPIGAAPEPQETGPYPGSAVLAPGHTYASVADKISTIVLTRKTPGGWLLGFGLAFALVMLLLYAISYLVIAGIGIWGVNFPVMWGFAIINFVWWIGIGHAGTLISAILLLLHQEWRTSINRFAEAMTLFAVACAGLFPLLHLGRPWFFYWLFPYPNTMGVWPQFRSPLVWDVFAVSTYALVSFMFWYVGLLPDLATLRDRARHPLARIAYGTLAMGWRGSAMHWKRYEMAYWLLAGLATPLVISVHTVVSFDFAIAIVPGWHSTLFPPYFVAGAIYSGFAMVMTLAIPIRRFYGLEDFITMRHLQAMAKVLLATGLMVAYGYLMEGFMAWYSGNQYESAMMANRLFGPYAPLFWSLLLCNVVVPQLLWLQRIRSNVLALFIIAIVVNIGMWLERFIIVVTSLHRDFLPSAWGLYVPTAWDWATFVGTIGLFFALLFLFVRVLPMISIFEMRELVSEMRGATAEDRG
jgi:Ni/Fe-hydrogenase subunit HybB-like protein